MLSYKRIEIVIVLIILAVCFMTACDSGDETDMMNNAIKSLLPDEEGYVWMYEGFAEYFHVMEIDSIVSESNGYHYNISGSVADMSSGEADRDFNLSIEYLIQEGTLIQIKEEEMMMDSIFDRLELIRYPLEEGFQWQQTQIDNEGEERDLTCTIEEIISSGGRDTYKVTYKDDNSDYYEKREIRSEVGVTRVEVLWMSDEGDNVLEYNLYRSLGPDENT